MDNLYYIDMKLNENTVEAAINFCVDIIIQTHEYAAAFKPNIAFFEAFGEDGIKALNKVISCIPTNIPIILDCKRGDIDSTAQVRLETKNFYVVVYIYFFVGLCSSLFQH